MKNIESLEDFKPNSRVCLYGTGHYGLAMFELLWTKRPDISVVYFIDTYKTGSLFDVEIIGPDEVKNLESRFDYIVIASDAYRDDIKAILEQRKIYNYCDFLFNPIDVPMPVMVDHVKEIKILYAVYDLNIYPGSFEIIEFMVLAEMERMRRSLDAIHLIVIPKPSYLMLNWDGNNATNGFHGDQVELVAWRIRQILLPCATLMPSCTATTVCASRSEAEVLFFSKTDLSVFPREYRIDTASSMLTYIPSYFQSLEKLTQIPSLRANSRAMGFVSDWIEKKQLQGKKIISITLREFPDYPLRNSSVEEWIQFAKSLDPQEFYPLFIRDTYNSFKDAMPGIPDNNIFNEVCWNMELRMALYEQSYVNLFVSSGPATLCMYNNNTSYITFKMVVEAYNVTSKTSYERMGFPVGTQLPDATPFRRVVWSSEDNFHTIRKEFDAFCRMKEEEDVARKNCNGRNSNEGKKV